MPSDADARLLRIAASQHGVFSRGQAIEVGLTRASIAGRLERGLWTRVHRGVYASAAVTLGPRARITAACLACGDGAIASHLSAAVVWGFTDELNIPHVTVATATFRQHPGIVVHRALTLDRVVHGSFPVTGPSRTLVDLAACVGEESLEMYVDAALRRRLVSVEKLRSYLSQPGTRRLAGTTELRQIVGVRDPNGAIGSELETKLLRLVRRAGLPLPVAQHQVRARGGTRFIDFAYPEPKLAIELDGYGVHGSRSAFEADRARQNRLEELGWHVLRFTWRQVVEDPVGVVTSIGVALGLEPVRWRLRRTLHVAAAVAKPGSR